MPAICRKTAKKISARAISVAPDTTTKGANKGIMSTAAKLFNTNPVATNSALPSSIFTITGALAASPAMPAKKAASAYSKNPKVLKNAHGASPKTTLRAMIQAWRRCGRKSRASMPKNVIRSMLPTMAGMQPENTCKAGQAMPMAKDSINPQVFRNFIITAGIIRSNKLLSRRIGASSVSFKMKCNSACCKMAYAGKMGTLQ